LLITTGTFTADARAESNRGGAPPIDLIDGDRLCDLLKEYSIVEDYTNVDRPEPRLGGRTDASNAERGVSEVV
jgi:hypothetical protein